MQQALCEDVSLRDGSRAEWHDSWCPWVHWSSCGGEDGVHAVELPRRDARYTNHHDIQSYPGQRELARPNGRSRHSGVSRHQLGQEQQGGLYRFADERAHSRQQQLYSRVCGCGDLIMSQSAVILPGSPLTGAAAAADMNAAWAAMTSKFSGTTAPTLGPGTLGALVAGQDWLGTSVNPYVWRVWDGTQWVVHGFIDPTNHLSNSALSWRNIAADNGGFEVWQRGAGASATFAVSATSTAYTADRWYLNTNANQACTVAAVTGLVNGSRLACKVQRNNGQTGVGVPVFGFPLDTDECAMIQC